MPSKTTSETIVWDAIIFLIVLSLIIIIRHGEPKRRGYFCNDDSIKYPYKESTISTYVLYFVGLTLPIAVFFVNELASGTIQTHDYQGQDTVLFGWRISPFTLVMLMTASIFLFGAALCVLATDIGKYSIGRLRPHFLQVCNSTINCSDPAQDPHMYVEEYECLGKDLNKIKENRQSFPSGHASFSAYTMIYTVIYIQMQMKCKTSRFLKPFLQFILILIACYTALSRITDHKHHWSDILVGFLLGALCAVLVTYFISDIFEKDPNKPAQNIIADSSKTVKSVATNTEDPD